MFMLGKDGNIWEAFSEGDAKEPKWKALPNISTYAANVSIVKSLGVFTIDKTRPYIFVLGSDGQLYSVYWADYTHWAWFCHGRPGVGIDIVDSMGALQSDYQAKYIFVLGNDNNLYSSRWEVVPNQPLGWKWYLHGSVHAPASIKKSMGSSIVHGNQPYVWLLDDSGVLYLNCLS